MINEQIFHRGPFISKFQRKRYLIRMRQNLLINLENSDLEYSAQLSDQLHSNLTDLCRLLSYYKKPSSTSLQQLDKGDVFIGGHSRKVTNEGKSIAIRLSTEMKLDQVQSFEMYWNYQRSREKLMLSNDTLKSEVFVTN